MYLLYSVVPGRQREVSTIMYLYCIQCGTWKAGGGQYYNVPVQYTVWYLEGSGRSVL